MLSGNKPLPKPIWPSSLTSYGVTIPQWVNYLTLQQIKILTHWGRVTHICVGNLTVNGPDNDLSPGRRQVIIWTNDGMLLIGHLVTNFNEIIIEIYIFSFKKMHLKLSSGSWRPFCLGLNVLKAIWWYGWVLTLHRWQVYMANLYERQIQIPMAIKCHVAFPSCNTVTL